MIKPRAEASNNYPYYHLYTAYVMGNKILSKFKILLIDLGRRFYKHLNPFNHE
jgi:hypothetical protein